MRKLPRPRIDDKRVFKEIAKAKSAPHCDVLEAIRIKVFRSYRSYIALAPALENVVCLQLATEKASLHHAYTVATLPMKKQREALFASVLAATCPYCGISESSTLDHYLPKETYAEFSVFSKNLLPCCGTCNGKKSQSIINGTSRIRMFLHPYFDTIPSRSFLSLSVKLHPTAIVLRYSVVQPKGLGNREYQQLKHHFERLELADRYRTMSLVELREGRSAFARLYGRTNDFQRVHQELLQKSEDYERDFGRNYWKVVLYRALSTNKQFCDGGFRILDKIQ